VNWVDCAVTGFPNTAVAIGIDCAASHDGTPEQRAGSCSRATPTASDGL
jgi:hypothetical protein